MEAPILDYNYLYSLDFENNLCVDCKSAMPQYVSINNAVIICHQCAMKHKSLGYNISYVRDIKSEWDPYLLSYILRGGNGRFIRLIRDFDIESLEIEYKYITKAAEYYRLLIKSEVYAEEPPEPLLKVNGIEYCNLNACYYPEFENYQIYEGEKQFVSDNTTGKLYNSFKHVGNGLGFICNSLSKSDIKDKLISGSAMTYNVLKVAGGFIFRTSKPVMNYVSKKATEGMGYIYHQMKENFIEEGEREGDEEEGEGDEDTHEYNAKQNKKKHSKRKDKAITRPRSIGRDSIRKSFLNSSVKKRSTSTGKNLIEDKDNSNYNKYCLEKKDITTSISLIDEKDEFYFIPVNDYPTYEEIMKYTQTHSINNITNSNANANANSNANVQMSNYNYNYHDLNNNINQPYQDINQYPTAKK